MKNFVAYNLSLKLPMLAVMVFAFAFSAKAQLQLLYKKKELSPTGVMGMGMFYQTIDEEGFPMGFRGDIRARVAHRLTAKVAYYRSNSMRSWQGKLNPTTNTQVEACILFNRLKMNGMGFGLYAGFDTGIRNTKFTDVLLQNHETGKDIGLSSNLNYNGSMSRETKVLISVEIPYNRLGLSFYNYTESRYEQYYLCYAFSKAIPDNIYTTDISNYKFAVPIRYGVSGLVNSRHGLILGYNALVKNLTVMDVEIGFRPSFYQASLEEDLNFLEKGFFFQFSAGLRIF